MAKNVTKSGRPQDAWGEKARREGYPARSVYKLEEIDRRVRVFRQGQRVLDLGAYPGSWTLYAARRVGPKGRALGIDLHAGKIALPTHAEMRQGDALTLDLTSLGVDTAFDVVMSDMAPPTTGHRHADQAKSFELFMRALEVADRVLAKGGMFIGKIFQGEDFPLAKRAMAQRFEKVRLIKPDASRQESYEIFFVGLGKRELAP